MARGPILARIAFKVGSRMLLKNKIKIKWDFFFFKKKKEKKKKEKPAMKNVFVSE